MGDLGVGRCCSIILGVSCVHSVITIFHTVRDGREVRQNDHRKKTHKNSSHRVAEKFVKGGSVSTVTIKG